MTLDLDDLERIGTSALVHNRVPCDLSKEPAINRFIVAAAQNWQAMLDELRRLRAENAKLEVELQPLRKLNKYLPVTVELAKCSNCGANSFVRGECLDCGFSMRTHISG